MVKKLSQGSQSGEGGIAAGWLDFQHSRPVVSATPPLLREGPPGQSLFATTAASAT